MKIREYPKPFFIYERLDYLDENSFNFNVSITNKCLSIMICWVIKNMHGGLIDMGIHQHIEKEE